MSGQSLRVNDITRIDQVVDGVRHEVHGLVHLVLRKLLVHIRRALYDWGG